MLIYNDSRTAGPCLMFSPTHVECEGVSMEFGDARVPSIVWGRLAKSENGCWLWDRPSRPHRHKFKVTIDGRQRPAHLVLYQALVGREIKLGAGHRIVRACGTEICCNPQHLKIDIRSRRTDRDLVGATFGFLTVVEQAAALERGDGATRKMWLCVCVCGSRKAIREHNLLDGETRSCGCQRYELLVRDLTGERFGKLVVLERAEGNGQRGAVWKVACDCGGTRSLRSGSLQRLKSCGKCQVPIDAKPSKSGRTRAYKKRGQGKDPRYPVWGGMLLRCLNPANPHFAEYGGRGIKVCEAWQGIDGFFNFAADVGDRPPGMHRGRSMWSLDRIDPNGNYEPGNVRWANQSEQMQNTRTARSRVERVLESFKDRDPELLAELKRELLGTK